MAKVRLSRRGFLKGVGVLSFCLIVKPRPLRAAAPSASALSPNALLRIEADNTIRIVMPHADMGTGIYTGLAQIMADELDADWQHIVTEHLDSLDPVFKHQDWGMISTGASTSVSSQWNNFRQVGATARAMLVESAARLWEVPASELRTKNSMVIDDQNDRRASYGELTAQAAVLTPPEDVTLKSPEQYNLIGRSLSRLDGRTKADGSALYGIDVQLPNLLYAAIAHAPVFGGKVKAFDACRAETMPGVRAVVEIPTGVAVVADSYWQAKVAKDALEITWDDGPFAAISSADLWHQYRELVRTDGPVFEQRGSINLEKAASCLEGEFFFPYLAHAPMEPLNATAQVKGDACEIWSGTQFQDFDVATLQQTVGLDPAKIKITTYWLGGSFGRRAAPNADFIVEAVQIAKASGLEQPIKLIWQREDDIQGGFYRPMVAHRYEIGLDANNLPVHWKHRIVCASITQGSPMEAAFDYNGFDLLSIEGLVHNKYTVPNVEYQLHTPKHPVPVCWLRGEAETHTAPVVETILNRLARTAGIDPFAMRRQLLGDNPEAFRILGVLDALEMVSNWNKTPPADIYRGMSVHSSFGSVLGFVVELKKAGNRLDFHKVTAAFDCGRVINPDSVKSQVYSCVAFALSMVIGQQITIASGRAVESNFHDYIVARLHQVPNVEVHLVDSSLDHPTGVGEVGVPPFIPALTEAIFAATDQDINTFPMQLEGYSFLEG